jgi:hypothetical protein
MKEFKFLKNNDIDDELLQFVNDNSFTILFFTIQHESVSFRKRNLLKQHDMTNQFRIMSITLLEYENNNFTYLIYNGAKYIKLIINKNPNINYTFDVLYCKQWTVEDYNYYN